MVHKFINSTALLTTCIILMSADVMAAGEAPSSLAVPVLKISGNSTFNAWFFDNRKKSVALQVKDGKVDNCKLQKYGLDHLFSVDDARLRFTADGKLDTGMEYGVTLVVDGTVGASKALRENYLFFGGSWGKILAGDTSGVLSMMAFGGYDNWGGTKFLDGGDFDRIVNYTTGVIHSTNLVGDSSRDTKFTYLSPRWNGIQVGITYVPRTEHRGEDTINSVTSTVTPKKPFDTDNISNGINFIHKFANGFDMALSATSVFALKTHREYRPNVVNRVEQTFPRKRRKTFGYCFGGTFSYADIGFSAEYGNNGHSRELQGLGGQPFRGNAGQFFDLGLSYKWGATKFSGGYYYSWRKVVGTDENTAKATLNGFTAAVDQKLAPGLGVYMEYAYFNMKNPAAQAEADRNNANNTCDFTGSVPSNKANVFVIGSRLVF